MLIIFGTSFLVLSCSFWFSCHGHCASGATMPGGGISPSDSSPGALSHDTNLGDAQLDHGAWKAYRMKMRQNQHK